MPDSFFCRTVVDKRSTMCYHFAIICSGYPLWMQHNVYNFSLNVRAFPLWYTCSNLLSNHLANVIHEVISLLRCYTTLLHCKTPDQLITTDARWTYDSLKHRVWSSKPSTFLRRLSIVCEKRVTQVPIYTYNNVNRWRWPCFDHKPHRRYLTDTVILRNFR